MECKFFIGQKVVCVADPEEARFTRAGVREAAPVMGGVYTIRDIRVESYGVGVLLEEVVNSPSQYADGYGEVNFDHTYFRPTTDITTFNEILARAPNPLDPPFSAPKELEPV